MVTVCGVSDGREGHNDRQDEIGVGVSHALLVAAALFGGFLAAAEAGAAETAVCPYNPNSNVSTCRIVSCCAHSPFASCLLDFIPKRLATEWMKGAGRGRMWHVSGDHPPTVFLEQQNNDLHPLSLQLLCCPLSLGPERNSLKT